MLRTSYLDSFMTLFKGNEDFYIEHIIHKPTKTTAKNQKLKSEAYFKKKKLSDRLYLSHLDGEKGLGICPVFDEEYAVFGCIDIDNYKVKLQPLIQALYDSSLPLFPCRSKSGGLHVYLFLKRAVKAKSVIEALEDVVTKLGIAKTYGEGNIEIFPKQYKISAETKGNGITAPYFDADDPISWLWSSTGKPVKAEKAFDTMLRGRTTLVELEKVMDNLDYSDAPACVQTILISSALTKDSGRNNFLFTCAVYLKKKYGEEFGRYLDMFNDKLSFPVSKKEIDAIKKSVLDNEYNYKCKDIPCKVYCDKVECSKREFGVGKHKGYFSGIDYGKLIRMKSEVPYYIWELKHVESEEYVPIVFKDEQSLLDQKVFSKMCVRHLNHAPFRVKDNEWFKVLNTVMDTTLEEIEVPKETDTSDRAEVRDAFIKFLAQKQSHLNMPLQVKLGFVYRNCTKYFFTHRGFEQFLDVEKIRLNKDDNLREILMKFGAKSDKLEYKTKKGAPVAVACWSKETEREITEIEEYYEDVMEADEDILDIAFEAEGEDGEDGEDLF